MVEDIKISEFAKEINVTSRTVQRWIYEGIMPSYENMKKISKTLNVSSSILFNSDAYKKSEIKNRRD